MSKEPSLFPEVNLLRDRLRNLKVADPTLVSMFEKPVMSRAFFPGGNGLALGEDASAFPVGGVMILGSNFGTAEKFCTAAGELICDDETRNPGTWTGLRKRFHQQELEDAFFTNAWPFLHSSKSNNPTGAEKKRWLQRPVLAPCLDFFFFSLAVVKPSIIVTLGTAPAAFLGHAFSEVLRPWQVGTWNAIDALPLARVSLDERKFVCVAQTHPSMSNVHSRKADLRDERELFLSAVKLRNQT